MTKETELTIIIENPEQGKQFMELINKLKVDYEEKNKHHLNNLHKVKPGESFIPANHEYVCIRKSDYDVLKEQLKLYNIPN